MLELIEKDHPILSVVMPTMPFDVINDNFKEIVKGMFKLMWDQKGIGLAAPQIGLVLRMFVMGSQEGPQYVCINPEVIEKKEIKIGSEGCLSFPKLWLNIKRETEIKVRYTTLEGNEVEQEFSGLMATCFLHELDHLNGITFDSRASKLGLKLAKERQIKALRKTKK